jgi:hypothetical protein
MISYEQSEQIGQLSQSLVAAQHVLHNPPKDSVNPFFKSRYADLATCRNILVPILAQHGLSVMQTPTFYQLPSGEVEPTLTTTLVHVSGEWCRSTMLLSATKDDPQGMGSAITYARRYSLLAITGTTGVDDDDGNAASKPKQQPQQRPASPPPPAKKPALAKDDPTPEDLKTELLRTGWTWARAMEAINNQEGTEYHPKTGLKEIKAAHLVGFYNHLTTLPDKEKP